MFNNKNWVLLVSLEREFYALSNDILFVKIGPGNKELLSPLKSVTNDIVQWQSSDT